MLLMFGRPAIDAGNACSARARKRCAIWSMSACNSQETRDSSKSASPATQIDRRMTDIARAEQHRHRPASRDSARQRRRLRRHAAQPDRSRHRLAAPDLRPVRLARSHLRKPTSAKRSSASPPTPRARNTRCRKSSCRPRRRSEFNEMEQGAMRLLQEMQRGAPFPLVARQFSQAPSAAAGGDLGWIASTELAPELQPDRRAPAAGPSLAARAHAERRLHHRHARPPRGRRRGRDARLSRCAKSRRLPRAQARWSACSRRVDGCGDLDDAVAASKAPSSSISAKPSKPNSRRPSAAASPASPIGGASPVVTDGEQANMIVVCARQTGGGGHPGSRSEIEGRLREAGTRDAG